VGCFCFKWHYFKVGNRSKEDEQKK